ncbi:MAG: hypothetical protein M5U19_11555 [Microthrixaceae bacterium]|nr:hypothetical protein [Microthrixaceae bacterium]
MRWLGIGLGGLAARALVDRLPHGEGAVQAVVAAQSEGPQLAVAKAGEAGDEDHRADPGVCDVGKRQDDLGGHERALAVRVRSGALDAARVAGIRSSSTAVARMACMIR